MREEAREARGALEAKLQKAHLLRLLSGYRVGALTRLGGDQTGEEDDTRRVGVGTGGRRLRFRTTCILSLWVFCLGTVCKETIYNTFRISLIQIFLMNDLQSVL